MPNLAGVEPGLIPVLERMSGLKGLGFDAEPADDDRAVQSMIDRNGRIVGWFSLEGRAAGDRDDVPGAAARRAHRARLCRFCGARRCGGSAGSASCLARSEQQLHKLTYEDPLTGLPNHRQLFDLFDRAALPRAGDETLAYVDHRSRRIRRGERRGRLCRRRRGAGRDRQAVARGRAARRADRPARQRRIRADDGRHRSRDGAAGRGCAAASHCAADLDRTRSCKSLPALDLRWRRRMARPATSSPAAPIWPCARPSGAGRAVRSRFTAEMEAEMQERRFIKRELARALGRPRLRSALPAHRQGRARRLLPGSKRCCAGIIRRGALFRRPCSCRSPKRRA